MKKKHITKWVEGTLSEDERRSFEVSDEYKSLKKFSKAALAKRVPEYNVEKELDKFNTPRSEKTISVNWLKPLLKIAAVFLLMTGGGYFYFVGKPPISKEIISLVKEPFLLPDSSRVILNTYSELKFSKTNWGKARLVDLRGEGYFKVSKGSKFEVLTELGTVKVLGTEFNVKIRQDYFEVTCYEGSVEVEISQKKYILKPRHMVRRIKGVVTERRGVSTKSPGWIDGESTFASIPLVHVIEEFERQYGVSVNRENLDLDQIYTGRFTHSDINLALKSIAIPLNLDYQIVNNRITFKSVLEK